MGYLIRPHTCPLPDASRELVGTFWQCDECQRTYYVGVMVATSYGMQIQGYDHWRPLVTPHTSLDQYWKEVCESDEWALNRLLEIAPPGTEDEVQAFTVGPGHIGAG